MKGIKKINENVVAPYRSLTIVNNGLPDNTNWQVGTLKCNPTVAGLQYKVADNTFDYFDASYILQPNTVTSELIKDGTIQTIDLADGCVTNDKIANRTINHIKLQLQTLTSDEYSSGSVVNRVLAEKAVTGNKIDDKTIEEVNMADNSVSGRCLQPNSVSSLHLMNSAVTEDKLANSSVSNPKLADGAVTWDKMASYTVIGGETTTVNGRVVQGRIAPKTITNYNVADYTITSTQIITGGVDNRCLADGAVDADKVRPKSLLGINLVDGTITSTQIGNGAIDTNNYKDASITKEKLAPNILSSVNNAVQYDDEGNVSMIKYSTCDVVIGSADTNGNSMKNGSLRVYGDIQGDRVYNMTYSDLAEGYIPGEDLEPGDIVELREDGKVYRAYRNNIDAVIVGVVSDEYAACYGATKEELEDGSKVAVALIGRVHVKIIGPIKIGEKVKVNNIPGVGCVWSNNKFVVGRALETVKEDGMHKVLCLIKPS